MRRVLLGVVLGVALALALPAVAQMSFRGDVGISIERATRKISAALTTRNINSRAALASWIDAATLAQKLDLALEVSLAGVVFRIADTDP